MMHHLSNEFLVEDVPGIAPGTRPACGLRGERQHPASRVGTPGRY